MNVPRLKPNFTTDRPVAVLMVFTALVVFGFFSFRRLPVTLMPELNYPTLTVRTEYPGAAPEEVENDISRPIEEALGVIPGLNRISSISRAGLSDVVLEFVWGTQMSDATQNTLEKLDLVFLPSEAERPLILHFDPALDPVMELSLSGSGTRYEAEQGLRRLRRIAEYQVKRALEPIPGVAAVRIRGGLEEEIHVLLDETKLRRAGLSIQRVIERLKQENINVAGGTVREGRAEYMVRTLNEFENLDQIADTVIHRSDGRDVRVRDLGSVSRSHKEREIVTRTDGAESVQIDIYKEGDANMVAVARAVVQRVGTIGELNAQNLSARRGPMQKGQSLATLIHHNEGARLQVVADRSIFIQSSIDEVRNTAIYGGLLAILVLFLFLGDLKTTLIISLSIPMSLLMTFAPLNLMDVSLNIMSLGGLALGVGMLVDSSIVVLESIFRCREEGHDIREAAIRGTQEVRGAVSASTLTSIAVFFPMVFVEGIAGQAFGDLGLAVVISLLASLFVAVLFIPMLASRRPAWRGTGMAGSWNWKRFASFELLCLDWNRTRPRLRPVLAPYFIIRFLLGLVLDLLGKAILAVSALLLFLIARVLWPPAARAGTALFALPARAMQRATERLKRSYPPLLETLLDRPGAVLGLIALTLAGTWLAARSLEAELLPEVHQSEFTFEVALPVGTPIEETQATLAHVEEAVLQNKEHIHAVLVTFGYDVTNIKRSDEGEHSARFKILLKPTRDPAATEEEVIQRFRGLFASVPDLSMRVVRPVLFSSKAPIVVEVHGDDLAALKKASDTARDLLANLPVLADVEASLRSGAPEIQVNYDRDQLMRHGLSIQLVAQQVRDMVKGNEATRFNMLDRRIPIVTRLEQTHRENISSIEQLTVNPGTQHPVPLHAVAQLAVGEGPSEVRRIDSRRCALIQASLRSGSLSSAVADIQELLESKMEWPPGLTFYISGQNEEWERSRTSLYLALGLSLFLVYVIMAAQFESLIYPLVIMGTVPLAFFGTAAGLMLLDINVSIVVFLGMIMLVGIVVNNAIVLVDYANTLKARGLTSRQAIVTAGAVRLRPILMTTATTILGLLPMAIGFGDGAEIRTPMAVAVICGLATSTLLTLVIIPALYYWMDRARDRVLAPAIQPADSVREVL